MYKVQISSSLEHHPHYIKILASDGKLINANRCNLVCVSRVIHNQLTSDLWVDPSVHSLDWKNYSSEVIEALLNLVNAGESSFPNEDLKNQVVALAKELEINITESVPVNPPKAPEALVLMKIQDCSIPEMVATLVVFASRFSPRSKEEWFIIKTSI